MFIRVHVIFLQGNRSQSGTCEGKDFSSEAFSVEVAIKVWFLISVLQILSAAGYHVLSLDYRGKMLIVAKLLF